MNHNDDAGPVVLLNSGSQYLKNYEKSIENWINLFVEDQKQHVLNVSRSGHTIINDKDDGPVSTGVAGLQDI